MKRIIPANLRVVVGVGSVLLLLLLIGGVVEIRAEQKRERVDAVIVLESDVSVELKLNREGNVVGQTAKTPDAQAMLRGVSLTGCPWQEAVKTVLWEMKTDGALSSNENAVLLTVKQEILTHPREWEDPLAEAVHDRMQEMGISGVVLSCTQKTDAELREMAEAYAISEGKAALVHCLVVANSGFSKEQLAQCSVTELVWLAANRKIPLDDFHQSGSAKIGGGIGSEEALRIALQSAGIRLEEAKYGTVTADCMDGVLGYRVELVCGERKFSGFVAVTDGRLCSWEWSGKDEKNS